MMLFMLNSMMMMFSIIFFQLKHPLAMGFLLLVQTILIALITGLMINSFWFSYILFLVFLGGMLVLFIYVTSLASNEMFNFSMNLMISSSLVMFILMVGMTLMDFVNFSYIFNYETYNLNLNNTFTENLESIYKLYNFSTNWITCMMISYLLFTLIVVVKITSFFYGPIRNLG